MPVQSGKEQSFRDVCIWRVEVSDVRRKREEREGESQCTFLTGILIWLSRFRAIKSNGTGTTIKFVLFLMVGRRSMDGWGTWGTW